MRRQIAAWPIFTIITVRICVGDTSQVGAYPTGASQYGALDMAGNVWEWVNDWYDDTYYSTSPYANPPGPVTGTYKVLRGGSWLRSNDYDLRVATRDYLAPTDLTTTSGFVVRRPPYGPDAGN